MFNVLLGGESPRPSNSSLSLSSFPPGLPADPPCADVRWSRLNVERFGGSALSGGSGRSTVNTTPVARALARTSRHVAMDEL